MNQKNEDLEPRVSEITPESQGSLNHLTGEQLREYLLEQSRYHRVHRNIFNRGDVKKGD